MAFAGKVLRGSMAGSMLW